MEIQTAVPEQVQQQLEQAQRMHAELYGPKEAPAEAVTTPEVTTEQVVEAPAPAPTPQVVAPETPAQPDPFEHKYKVLEGKYRAEVPRLHQEARELRAQLQQAVDKLAALERPAEQVKPKESLVTEKDVEDFGADLVDLTRRVAREVVSQEAASIIASLEQRFAQLTSQLGQVQETAVQSAADVFWGKVIGLIPDWEQVDADLTWHAFLDARIPGTRKTRRQEAVEAIEAGDPVPIKELVDLWRTPVAAPPVQTSAERVTEQARAELQRQVVPPTSKASTPSSTPRFWSGAEYERVFSPQAAHTYPKDQLAQLQAEATQALAEGRVRF